MRILVTGGTGTTGSRVAAKLRHAGHEAVVASRAGLSGVTFDWKDHATHAAVARDVGAAYLVAPSGEFDLLAAMVPFIDSLLKAGVGRIVLLSAASIERGGPMMGAVHDYLAHNAPCWTVLRPSWFMQNFSERQHRETILSEDAIYSAAGDGRVGWIDAGDIAAVAAATLVDERRDNGDIVITGPEALGYDELAATIGAALGRTILHRRLTEDQLAARFEATGMPPDYAATLAGMDTAIAAGAGDFVTGAVTDVTGVRPTSFYHFTQDTRAAWLRTTDKEFAG
jgi:ergot alkaloid biosynthesis protein